MEFFESHVSLKNGNPETQILRPRFPARGLKRRKYLGEGKRRIRTRGHSSGDNTGLRNGSNLSRFWASAYYKIWWLAAVTRRSQKRESTGLD